MSDVEIYHVATVARAKLLCEVSFKDHDLHRLVAHANLYDKLLNVYYDFDTKTDARFEIPTHDPVSGRVGSIVPPFLTKTRGTESAQGLGRLVAPHKVAPGLCREDIPQYEDAGFESSSNYALVTVEEVEFAEDDD